MTRDDIIRMAQKAGVPMQYSFVGGATRWDFDPSLEHFAKLVAAEYERQRKAAGRYEDGYRAGAAAEREECAKEIEAEICDEIEDEAYHILVELLKRIRARGQQ